MKLNKNDLKTIKVLNDKILHPYMKSILLVYEQYREMEMFFGNRIYWQIQVLVRNPIRASTSTLTP